MQARTATERRWPLVLGAVLWILSTVQYVAAQVITAAAWHSPAYSWTANYISDLGNTACGPFAVSGGPSNYVCSPRYALMDGSFVTTGVLTFLGALLLIRFWPASRRRTWAFWLLVIASPLKVIVGLVPENTTASLHTLGALNLPISSVAILLLGLAMRRERPKLAAFSVLVAIVALVGACLFTASQSGSTALDLGLGIGGMERLAGYPANLWMVVVALAALMSRPRQDDVPTASPAYRQSDAARA